MIQLARAVILASFVAIAVPSGASAADAAADLRLDVPSIGRLRTLRPHPWDVQVVATNVGPRCRELELREVRLVSASGEVLDHVALGRKLEGVGDLDAQARRIAAAERSDGHGHDATQDGKARDPLSPGQSATLGRGRVWATLRFDPARYAGGLVAGSTLAARVEADYSIRGVVRTATAEYRVDVDPWLLPPVPEGAHHSNWYIGNTHVHSLDYSSCDGKYSAQLSLSRTGTSPIDSTGGVPSQDSELEQLAFSQGLQWMNVAEHCYCFPCRVYCEDGERDGNCRAVDGRFRSEHTCKAASQSSFGPGSTGYQNWAHFQEIVDDQNANQPPETFLTLPGIELTVQDYRGDCASIRNNNHAHLTGVGMRRAEQGGLVGCPIDSYDWHGMAGGLAFNSSSSAATGIARLEAANPYGIAILNHVEGFGAAFVSVHGTNEDTLRCLGTPASDPETGWELISTADFAYNASSPVDLKRAVKKWIEYRLNRGFRSVAFGAADYHYFYDHSTDRDPSITNDERLGHVATVVYAESLTQDAIGIGLRNGQTYATTGPGVAVWVCRVDDAGDRVGPWTWMGEYMSTVPGEKMEVLVSYNVRRPSVLNAFCGRPNLIDPVNVDRAVFTGVVDGTGQIRVTGPDGPAMRVEDFDSFLVYFRASVEAIDDKEQVAFTTPVWIKVGSPARGSNDATIAANFEKNRCLSHIEYTGPGGDFPEGVETDCTLLNLPDAEDPSSGPPRLTQSPVYPRCDATECAGCCTRTGHCIPGRSDRRCGSDGGDCENCRERLLAEEQWCVETVTGRQCGCASDEDCALSVRGSRCGESTGHCGCLDDADCAPGQTCLCRGCDADVPGICR